MLISVGYRVNSITATKFRQWATKTLNDHITQGFTVNQHLLDIKKTHAQDIIDSIDEVSINSSKVQTGDVLELVKAFTHTWFSLQSYDEGALPKKGKHVLNVNIRVSELYSAVAELKAILKEKGEATDLFAQKKSRAVWMELSEPLCKVYLAKMLIRVLKRKRRIYFISL